jgi:hypothetical protein
VNRAIFVSYPRIAGVIALVSAIAACVATAPVSGPVPPGPSEVSSIKVVPIPPAEGSARDVSDQAVPILSSAALSPDGWVASEGRALEPLYRLDFIDGTKVVAVYWLGANSHPPRFPCYSLCSGWWIGGSTAAGTLDPARYKGLTSSSYFYLLRYLRVP